MSEFVDGTLDATELQALEAHLSTCAGCAGLVRDLELLRQTARGLGPIDPPPHLWLEIAGQVRQSAQPASPSSAPAPRVAPVWQWSGLAAALVILTTGTYVFLRIERRAPAPPPIAATPTTGSVQVVADELTQAMTHYEKAISELEVITKSNNGALDPALAATLQKNLVVIDAAITESRTALAQDPASVPARDSLFEALQRKVSVLQETIALINDVRQGDQAGVARAVAGLPKKS